MPGGVEQEGFCEKRLRSQDKLAGQLPVANVLVT